MARHKRLRELVLTALQQAKASVNPTSFQLPSDHKMMHMDVGGTSVHAQIPNILVIYIYIL